MSSNNKLHMKTWVLKKRPEGHFDGDRDVELRENVLNLDLVDFTGPPYQKEEKNDKDDKENKATQDPPPLPNAKGALTLAPTGLVIEVEALSVDAFLRTMLDATAFHGSVALGSPMPAIGYGTVLRAGPDAGFKVGAKIMGMLSASTIVVTHDGSDLNSAGVSSLPGVASTASLGVLGLSGLTACVGMFYAPSVAPKATDTVVVSAAAGGCGSVAVQLAKHVTGCQRVVGIAGGPVKQAFLKDTVGLDGAIDYKSKEKSLAEQLDEQCPDGIDFFFDNVGGETLDLVLERINQGARIVICGAVSQYSNGNINNGQTQGPSNYTELCKKNATMTGFVVTSQPMWMGKAFAKLLWNYYRGRLVQHEHLTDGIESFPKALEAIFTGSHCGRLIVDVDGKQKIKK